MTTNEEPAQVRARVVQAIRSTREKRDLSAAALADLTDGAITRDTIANLESGRKRVIDVAEVIVIAKALGVPPLSLIYPDPTQDDSALWFAGYIEDTSNNPPTDLLPLYRLHDAREWYRDDDSAPARQALKSAVRDAKSRGWTVD